MSATNAELTAQLGLDLGIDLKNRRPYAKELFKIYDIELLPNASEDTLLGEIFEWQTRNWRTTSDNLVGYIASSPQMELLVDQLKNMPKINANVPNFEFTKEDVLDLGFKLPFLFNLSFTGKVEQAKNISVKINGVKKVRLSNIQQPGTQIANLLSIFSEQNTKRYRECIKNDFITESLFYADSVEIDMDKDAATDIGINFDINSVNVESELKTDTKQTYKITYQDAKLIPFGATFKKGKDLFH